MNDVANSAGPAPDRLIFVGGLHRSGTTLLADLLGAHPEISALKNTSAWHDEGQFLQDVYPTAHSCGGPGRFAFASEAHLTEHDVDDARATRHRLLRSWTPFWDLEKPYVLEKSPPNLLRFRYLQEIFPGAQFIAIVRHPVAVAYATQPWAEASISDLIEHWLHAHELFERDRRNFDRIQLVRYEDLVRDVPGTLARITTDLGLATHTPELEVNTNANARYVRRWRHSRLVPVHPRIAHYTIRYGQRLRRIGYGYGFGGSVSRAG